MANSVLRRILESDVVDDAIATAKEYIQAGSAENFAIIMKSLALVAKLESELGGVPDLGSDEVAAAQNPPASSPYAEIIALGQRSRRA